MNVEIHDNSKEVSAAIQAALVRGLEKCGLVAERYAKKLCPVAEDHGGTLRDSITHVVDEEEPAVYVGTNSEYAPYVELGTGIYAEGGGRPTPWAYKDAKGNWHYTRAAMLLKSGEKMINISILQVKKSLHSQKRTPAFAGVLVRMERQLHSLACLFCSWFWFLF